MPHFVRVQIAFAVSFQWKKIIYLTQCLILQGNWSPWDKKVIFQYHHLIQKQHRLHFTWTISGVFKHTRFRFYAYYGAVIIVQLEAASLPQITGIICY